MKFSVTQKNIDKGRIGSFTTCAVALAIKDQMPNAFVEVDCNRINIEGVHFTTPDEVRSFIADFDGFPETPLPRPFTFTLEE